MCACVSSCLKCHPVNKICCHRNKRAFAWNTDTCDVVAKESEKEEAQDTMSWLPEFANVYFKICADHLIPLALNFYSNSMLKVVK